MTAPANDSAEVLIVGGGPAGLAAAIELGRRGRRVTVVDRGHAERGPSMLLTPRAVTATRRLGIDPGECFHRVELVRVTSITPHEPVGRSTSTTWPRFRAAPEPGCVGPLHELVESLRDLAADVGVRVLGEHEATEPIVERGFVRGIKVRANHGRVGNLRAGYTVVADGPGSQFGRMLGTFRDPNWPHAHIHAADFASPLHAAAEIEIVVGITDRADTPIAGYGWMFPTGRGTVSVGLVLMSTSPSFQVINPAQLHEQFVATQRDRWQLDGPPICPPIGGRVPMGSSVGPIAGPTWVTIGDAAGAANPLTAMGIETALETGIMAGEVVADALDQDSAAVLQQYPKLLAERYGSYYKVGRLTDRLLGRPAAARRIHAAMSSRPALADGALRIATQHLRGGRGGGVETFYRLARAVSIVAPDA